MELTIKNISIHIIENYKESCFSQNYKNHSELLDEEYMRDTFLEEILKFFNYEIIGLCGCGHTDETDKSILRILKRILKFQENNSNKPKPEDEDLYNNCSVTYRGLVQFILYILDNKGILTHGFQIWNANLTELGQMYLYALDKFYSDEDIKDITFNSDTGGGGFEI